MPTTPRLAITQLVEGQASGETTANEALVIHEALLSGKVLDSTLATPPGSPVNGDLYVVAASPTGAWTGQAGKLALYLNGWRFFTAVGGLVMYDHQAKEWIGYSSQASAWHPLQDRWSTTEHFTGKYIGGFPVYAKVITFGNLGAASKSVAHGITGAKFDQYQRIAASAQLASPATAFPIPWISSGGIIVDILVDGTNVTISANFDISAATAYVRLEYAK